MPISKTGKTHFSAWPAILAVLATAFTSSADAKIEIYWVKTYDVELVQDIREGNLGSIPEFFAVYDGALYFKARGSVETGAELWKYDGNTVSLVADIHLGSEDSNPSEMTAFGGSLYFTAEDSAHGRELWKYDGAAPSLVADIKPGPEWILGPSWLTVYNGALYFNAEDGVHGWELWKYDGNTVNMVSDLYPGEGWSAPSHLTVFDGALFFVADHPVQGRDLWKYDGGSPSIAIDLSDSHDLFPGHGLVVYAGELYLKESGPKCPILCKYDGSLTPVPVDIGTAQYPEHLTVYSDALYFNAYDESHGFEPWKYDGNTASLAADIFAGEGSSSPNWFTQFDGELFFRASDGAHGAELFRNTSLARDIRPGSSGSNPADLKVFDEALYFRADDGIHGLELWRFRYTGQFPKFYAEWTSPFEKWWEWPIEPQRLSARFAGTAAFLALSEEAAPRLLARRTMSLNDPGTVAEPLYDSPLLDPERLPPDLALLGVLVHQATERIVVSEILVTALDGETDARLRQRLEAQARAFLDSLTLEKLNAMPVEDLPAADESIVEPGYSVSLGALLLIAALVVVLTALSVWLALKRLTN